MIWYVHFVSPIRACALVNIYTICKVGVTQPSVNQYALNALSKDVLEGINLFISMSNHTSSFQPHTKNAPIPKSRPS